MNKQQIIVNLSNLEMEDDIDLHRNINNEISMPVYLQADDRMRHICDFVGKTDTVLSNLMKAMVLADICTGGIAFIDEPCGE